MRASPHCHSNRRMLSTRVVRRTTEKKEHKKVLDARNLYLAAEGVIREGDAAAGEPLPCDHCLRAVTACDHVPRLPVAIDVCLLVASSCHGLLCPAAHSDGLCCSPPDEG